MAHRLRVLTRCYLFKCAEFLHCVNLERIVFVATACRLQKNEFLVIIQRIVWLSKASGVREECEFEKIDIDSTGATFSIIHNVLFE